MTDDKYKSCNHTCDLLGCQYNEDSYCVYTTAKIKIPFGTACVAKAIDECEE